MKKLLCYLFILSFVLLSACAERTVDDNSTEASEESFEEVSFSASSEESVQEEESSFVISEEETTDEQSIEPPAPSTEEITAEIAGLSAAGFTTNIEGCDALNALQAYLEGTGYGYFYCDLEYNTYAAFGCDKIFKTASTAKLPYVKYLCTLADKGEINLNDTMLFEAKHKTDGSGVMKGYATGVNYTIATLMDYTLRYSDNIAYSMLIEKYGQKGYLEHVKSLGVNYATATNGYTNCTASTMAALLFDTALYNGENLALMQAAGCNASYNYQIGAELKEHKVLQKYGAMRPGNIAYHDIAVVYAPHPYILVIYTTIDYDSAGKNIPFRTLARLTDDLNKALYGN